MIEGRHLRITQAGMVGYNGPLGMVQFKDGVSVAPVGPLETDRLSALFGIVDHETGAPVGIQVRMADRARPLAEAKSNEERLAAKALDEMQKRQAAQPEPEGKLRRFTEEELGSVADGHGINGLREIADKLKVKGRSINDLIKAILEAQDRLFELRPHAFVAR